MSNSNNTKEENTLQSLVANNPFLQGINIDAFEKYMQETNISKKNDNDICKLIDDDINVTVKKERIKNQAKCTYPNNLTDIGCIIRYEE